MLTELMASRDKLHCNAFLVPVYKRTYSSKPLAESFQNLGMAYFTLSCVSGYTQACEQPLRCIRFTPANRLSHRLTELPWKQRNNVLLRITYIRFFGGRHVYERHDSSRSAQHMNNLSSNRRSIKHAPINVRVGPLNTVTAFESPSQKLPISAACTSNPQLRSAFAILPWPLDGSTSKSHLSANI